MSAAAAHVYHERDVLVARRRDPGPRAWHWQVRILTSRLWPTKIGAVPRCCGGALRRVAPAVESEVRVKEPEELTHIDAKGRARMVDVGDKPATRRQARAQARVHMRPDVLGKLQAGELRKGDALLVARLAGIQAAKQTPHLVPLCHSLHLEHVDVEAHVDVENSCVRLESQVTCTGATGVEMEAIVAASIAAVTIYDMCKALDRSMVIEGIELLEKSGGRSGDYRKTAPTSHRR